VVKAGDRSQVPGGCHDTPAEAGKHKAALDAAMEQEGEMSDTLAEVQAQMDARGLYGPYGDDEFADRDELRQARDARAKKYDIGVKAKSNLTPPRGYPAAEADYGDPVNLRYPADTAHAQPAVGYYNHEGQREAGGYSSEEWAVVGKRLATICSRNLRGDYEYADGKLTPKREQVEKAVTLKSKAQRLSRDLVALLGEKDLPAVLRKELEDVRGALRKTWAQLGAGEDEEPEEHGDREPFVHVVPFSLADAEKRVVYGIVLESDAIDTQGHTLTTEDVEAACHNFMARLQGGGGPFLDEHHARLVQSDEAALIESWIQKEPTVWKFAVDGEERETEIKVGSWCAAVKVADDDLWEQVQDGGIRGFSVVGRGVLTTL